jgi:hypothetical protein
MPCDGPHGGLAPGEAVLRVGTWNMSHWTAEKVAMVAENVAVDILALQETHLAQVPVEVAHTTARCAGLHLHHGLLVAERPHSEHGRSCGVGSLCRRASRCRRQRLPALPGVCCMRCAACMLYNLPLVKGCLGVCCSSRCMHRFGAMDKTSLGPGLTWP